MSPLDQVITLFLERGHSEYGGESVTQLEHALQCAELAEGEGASAELITAALMHDIGHLVHALPADAPEQGIDDQHEELGNRYLQRIFPAAVTEPVRLHVAAKRYLCAVDPTYLDQLSGPSKLSLRLQGGPMSATEVQAFEAGPYALDAALLRRWDDAAKVQGLRTPGIQHFAQYIRASLLPSRG